jgi:hypothetical protein
MKQLSNDMVQSEHVEKAIFGGYIIGSVLLILHFIFGKKAMDIGGRVAKVFVEFQRKSFHMIGGCVLCSLYHWGLKYGYLGSAYMGDATVHPEGAHPLDAASAFIAACFICWITEAARLMLSGFQNFLLSRFKALVREKEVNKATGVAYFLPGCVAAMMAGPSNFAIMGMLFLPIGDVAASTETAGGFIKVGLLLGN